MLSLSNSTNNQVLSSLGLIFLLFVTVFGAISKFLSPSSNGLPLSSSLQYTIGAFQLISALLLLFPKWRRIGIRLAAMNCIGFALWWNTANPSAMIFSLFVLTICGFLEFSRFEKEPKRKEQEEEVAVPITAEIENILIEENISPETPIQIETATGLQIPAWFKEKPIEGNSHIQETLPMKEPALVLEPETPHQKIDIPEEASHLESVIIEEKPKLWMEMIEGDALMDWIYGKEGEPYKDSSS